jgi:hypothetical protein
MVKRDHYFNGQHNNNRVVMGRSEDVFRAQWNCWIW